MTHCTSAPSPATKVVSTGHQPPPDASTRYSTVLAPGPRTHARCTDMTRSQSSGWISAWIGLPSSVSRGTPVSSESERRDVDERSGRIVERNQRAHVACEQPETLLPRVDGESVVVYSLQMALGRDHARLIGGGRASLSRVAREVGQRAVQLPRRQLAEPEALEPVALVRRVKGVRAQRKAAHDGRRALLRQHREQRQGSAQPHEGGRHAARALERSRGQLQRRLAGIEQGGVGEVELDRDLGTVRRRGPQQPLELRPDLRCALPRRQPHAQLRAGHRRDHRARLAAREHVHVNGRLGAGALPELARPRRA